MLRQSTARAAGSVSTFALIDGTDLEDLLNGTAGNDRISGRGGNDQIHGLAGDDRLSGEAGSDILNGDAGNDRLFGGSDDDTLLGGVGRDSLFGQGENDALFGQEGDDHLYGGTGGDFLVDYQGNDALDGGPGDDRLLSGTGRDVIIGGDDRDIIFSHGGNDRIEGGADGDWASGGPGNDAVAGGGGNDVLWGGPGNDRLSGQGGRDEVQGGSGKDTLRGGTGVDVLRGGLGDDVLYGDTDGDTLYGQRGNDQVWGGTGSDILYGDSGSEYAVQALLPAPPVAAGLSRQFATDGRTLVLGDGSGKLFVYDVFTQKQTAQFTVTVTGQAVPANLNVAVSEGRMLVGSPNSGHPDQALRLYDTQGRFLHSLRDPDPQGDAGFGTKIALDGDHAVVATNTAVHIFDANTGALRHTYTLPPPSFGDGYFVSRPWVSGDTVAVHAEYSAGGTPEYVFVIDADTGTLRHQVSGAGHDLDEAGHRSIALDGNTLAITEPQDHASESFFEQVHQYDAESGKFVRTLDLTDTPDALLPTQVRSVTSVEADNREILVSTYTQATNSFPVSPDFLLFDADSGRLVQRIANTEANADHYWTQAAFADGVIATFVPQPAFFNDSDPAAAKDPNSHVALFWRDRPVDGGADILHGGNGEDQIYGGGGRDRLFGENGNDLLRGGPGDDELWGGPGADYFYVERGSGQDRIEDFRPGEDHVLFIVPGIGSSANLRFSETEDGVQITAGKESVELINVELGQISPDLFLFS
jgi:Ca2+-binding RTX toxin-like protein